MTEIKEAERFEPINTVEVVVKIQVYDNYGGERILNEQEGLIVRKIALADAIVMNYDDNITNMKRWALDEAMRAVVQGYKGR